MSLYKILNNAYIIENFNECIFQLKLVDDKESLRKGLMFQDHIDRNHGMLFDFGEMKFNRLWMKNTKIPLDAVFMDNNYIIVGFVKNMTPYSLNTYGIDKKSRFIAEINQGEIDKCNLKIGDKLQFNLSN